jgi:hypothetical protein
VLTTNPPPLGDCNTHDGRVAVLHMVVLLAQLLEQLGGALDVCEEESDGACRKPCHEPLSRTVLSRRGGLAKHARGCTASPEWPRPYAPPKSPGALGRLSTVVPPTRLLQGQGRPE